MDGRNPEMFEKPKLYVGNGKNFIAVLKVAMKVARENQIDEMAMLRDVQSLPTIEERKERLSNYFEVL